MEREKILDAVKKLKENEKRKFSQSIDLIINLKNFDVKKENVNLFLELPHKIKDVKVCAFLNKKSNIMNTIIKQEFDNYKNKKNIKKLVREYNFFISSASLMPQVATTFGRYLGSAGKMPSPELGIIRNETEEEIRNTIKKFENIIRVKSKEPSLKFCIGKENMKDEEIVENIIAAYNIILNKLPRKKENVKSVMVKLTMGKPIKLG